MVTLKKVPVSDRNTLWNMVQKYFYELSAIYDMEMDAAGNYEYRYFDSYFEQPGRTALFICHDRTRIGFALINNFSCLGDSIEYAVAEFTIFPRYRHRHFAAEAVRQLFRTYPGKWEIKYSRRNPAAETLWKNAAREYAPGVSRYGETECVLSFTVPRIG